MIAGLRARTPWSPSASSSLWLSAVSASPPSSDGQSNRTRLPSPSLEATAVAFSDTATAVVSQKRHTQRPAKTPIRVTEVLTPHPEARETTALDSLFARNHSTLPDPTKVGVLTRTPLLSLVLPASSQEVIRAGTSTPTAGAPVTARRGEVND
jgi:hypothetical protein